MLINTVLLFLQSALPMFILISLLLLRFNAASVSLGTRENWIKISLLSGLLVFILSQNMEGISQLFDGKGTEVIFSFGFVLIYFCSVHLFLFDNKDHITNVKKSLASTLFLLVLLLNGSHFVLYFSSYLTQSPSFEFSGGELAGFESLFIGIILAVGICISFAILLYFLLRYCDAFIHTKTSRYFLLFFATGQLMQTIVLLQQVDILPMSHIVWNSSSLITENSEIGQLLRVLIGYETTPSIMQLITYLIAFIVPVLMRKSRYINRLAYGEKS
ncbi:MAG: hypothetical protein JKX76_10740 [Colwellia sp.]|nr:hypothetical protein [Colwellia sp.]